MTFPKQISLTVAMSIENKRLKELAGLIRTKQIELETLQIFLREAYVRKLDPAELGVSIAELGRQLSGWEREWAFLFRERTEEEQDRGGTLHDRSSRASAHDAVGPG